MIRLSRACLAFAVAAWFALGLAACGDDAGPDPTPAGSSASTPAVSGNITVFAAASLTDAFTELAAEFKVSM